MGIGEAIKKGFGVAVQSFDLIFTLFAFGLAWNGVNIYYSKKISSEALAAPSPLVAILGGAFLLISIFMQGGSLAYVRDKIKTGSAGLSTFTASGIKYYLRILLLGIVIAAIAGAFLLAAGLLTTKLQTIGIVLAVILGGIGIYLILLVFLAPYIVVVDEGKAFASLSKSVTVVRKNLLLVLAVALLLVAIGFLIGLVLGLLLGLLTVVIKGVASQIVVAVLSSLVNAFLGVVVSASFMHIYLSHNTSGAK